MTRTYSSRPHRSGDSTGMRAPASDDETMWTEVMLEHFPEVAGFRPFGDPLENFRKHEARESARGGRRARRDEF